jgi:hypothetical protein
MQVVKTYFRLVLKDGQNRLDSVCFEQHHCAEARGLGLNCDFNEHYGITRSAALELINRWNTGETNFKYWII